MNIRYLVKYGREIVRPFKVGPEVLEPDLVSSRGCLARRSEFGAQLHLLDAASALICRLKPAETRTESNGLRRLHKQETAWARLNWRLDEHLG